MKQMINPAMLDSIYAFFTTTEEEAVKMITVAYAKIYEDHPFVIGFSDEDSQFGSEAAEGSVIFTIRTKNEEEPDDRVHMAWGMGKQREQKPSLTNYQEEADYDENIRMNYFVDECLLTVQIFDDEGNKPLYENIMLVKYLVEMGS